MDSNRLPGKALIDICGRSLLGRVIDRAKNIKGAERIIVATSSRSIDNPITSFWNRSIFPILYQWRKLGIIIFTIGVIVLFHFNFVLVSNEKIVVCVFYPIILTLTKVVRWEQFKFLIKNR